MKILIGKSQSTNRQLIGFGAVGRLVRLLGLNSQREMKRPEKGKKKANRKREREK